LKREQQQPKVEYYHGKSPPNADLAPLAPSAKQVTPIKPVISEKKPVPTIVSSNIKNHIDDNASSIKETSSIRKEAQTSKMEDTDGIKEKID
jgi:hypothetical protein